jgi:hypothetical protein
MSAIRVLMCDMPPMLQSMVREMLQAETDIEILSLPGKGEPISGDFDVLLVSESHFTESETPVGQIASFGASGIVAIGDGVTRATVLHFQCSDRDLTGDSSDSVSAAIRDAFRPGWKH